MIINDPVFGELSYFLVWSKHMTIHFCGKETEITLTVKGEEDGKFDEEQYMAYQSLMQNWEHIQQRVLQAILDYYMQKRHELGYDIEYQEDYPLIETQDQLLERVVLLEIVVPYGDIFEGRDIGLLFDCAWDEENGLGLRILNEEITEVGYQDVAI
ncbi:DUF2004 domain-containing protein [Brevibacillus brevis]|uniref:DUF2004 domain-containing protein n=1 Tax=Brevibacillus brevis TaxID=1393 RepID=A0A2Z4MMM4_BREBE|nr:DUF2004 domain-containing protein [Brevibacillus brevis]AWX57708.1 DUF2004 domain-containing protein [Brevibacillus brevis]